LHIKGVTKGKVKKWRKKVPLQQRLKLRMAGVNSMERFYRKNLIDQYPPVFSMFTILGIRVFKLARRAGIFLSYYTGR
ncbi:MAG: hypothetical protein ACC618_04520, partial [Patescibacteria group bacterium]